MTKDQTSDTAARRRRDRGRRRAPGLRAQDYTIGVSNTVQGNGWREEMICAMKAQALASGKVASLNIAHRNTDAAGQLEDIRNLIGAGVNAIVVNPADPAGINAAIKEATDAGIVVVAVDQAVTEPSAYVISNNQEEYAYLGAKWLFEQIGGKGDVVYMRGAAGASADSDRDKGFKRALAEFPDVKVAHEVFTGWQQDQGKQQILDFIATGVPFDGIWTSGIDNVIVDALVESDVAAGAGRRRRQRRLRRPAHLGRGPEGRGGDQPRLDRRRGRHARAADPRRQEAGRADRARQARALGERHREGKAKIAAAAEPVARPGMAGLDLDPRLDDLHQGPDHRLQGPGRVIRVSTRRSRVRPPAAAPRLLDRKTAPLEPRDRHRTALLDATGVAKSFGAVAALRNASLSVRRGEVHALMGANGAGKSTLVKILTGAVRPDAGRS